MKTTPRNALKWCLATLLLGVAVWEAMPLLERAPVTASLAKTARVWDAQTDRPLTEPLKNEAGDLTAQFNPDGSRVVTTSRDKATRVWDARTAQPLSEPLKNEAGVRESKPGKD